MTNFRVYIAGPMSAYGNYNFPLFDQVAKVLIDSNFTVFNPADHAREQLGPLEKIQKMDKADLEEAIRKLLFPTQITWICQEADAVLMLPGWQQSTGAKIEREVALYFNKPVRELANILLLNEKDTQQYVGALSLDLASSMA